METKAQSLHEAIAMLNQGRQLPLADIQTPPPPPSIKGIMDGSQETNAGISLLVSIRYRSLSDHLKDRDVLIRRVIRNKNDLYLDGVAMDIRAPRLIKVAHILEIRDITSGRVYQDPLEFIENRLGVSLPKTRVKKEPKNEFPKVIERTAQEMTALMYLVAIDGQRDTRERKVVFDYIKSRTLDLTYPDTDLNEYLISLAPDTESFSVALGQILKKEKDVVQRFIEAVLDVIMIDGKVDPRERSFLVRLMDVLEKDGYEITLPI
ncbi:MAG: TerB family tellurite resistance protein [Alphaproteobacteria bacterium]|nr:TerB family tellurite resistance protein [Alphaproteobacteria bacterium]